MFPITSPFPKSVESFLLFFLLDLWKHTKPMIIHFWNSLVFTGGGAEEGCWWGVELRPDYLAYQHIFIKGKGPENCFSRGSWTHSGWLWRFPQYHSLWSHFSFLGWLLFPGGLLKCGDPGVLLFALLSLHALEMSHSLLMAPALTTCCQLLSLHLQLPTLSRTLGPNI